MAVIVLYRPNHTHLNYLSEVIKIFEYVTIIDNSERRKGAAFPIRPNVNYVEMPRNVGLGAAYNLAIQGSESSIEKFITFDQDTLVDERIRSVISAVSPGSLEIHSACWSGDASPYRQPVEEVPWTISSTMCFSRLLFDSVGSFDSDMFIDYVDLDFCLKAKSLGSKIFRHNDVRIGHVMGDPVTRRLALGFFVVSSSNHSAPRRYFMGRNLRKMSRRYFSKFPRLVFRLYLSKFLMLILIIMVEKYKTRKIREFFRGYFSD